MFIVSGTIGKTVITYNCDTITEVKEKLHFIKLDREKYGRKWKSVRVIAIKEDIINLLKEYL